MSLRVIAVDTGADKKALCHSYGAEIFLDFKNGGASIEAIKAAAGGLGPHVRSSLLSALLLFSLRRR